MDDQIPDGTRVVYRGSIAITYGMVFRAEECACDRDVCGYQLVDATDVVILHHVRRGSITPA
ncbi:hypothetical protein [Actinacidiphila rubida]|uniref:Uncharacterized protein n=1 Tax=Actinacidiphila rubida TaxID=310780 RepID=A0A1H8SZC9_9ACTN|nr:hypothetical protein [Actinacidiphila rubida]SEO84017.1 hypothetical protein SAMN05216267_104680 [Actinacidiphila rubida]